MPRKAKDEKITEQATINEKKSTAVKKVNTTKKSTTSAKKVVSNKKVSNTKKTTTNNSASKPKKAVASSKKSTTKKSSKKVVAPVEYYDLPTVYNKTIIKILAQTPSCLFVYWEVSEKDKLDFQKKYGKEFFQNTKPYLIIINETMNYSFEVEINDYANSWYIHINDSDCKYTVKLIRKSIEHNTQISIPNAVDIASSNEMDTPNDHILFDRLGKTVFFKNVKTNIISQKNISSISFISNIGKVYNIYDFYKEIYKNELNGDELGMRLPSSQFSSSFK